MTSLTADAGPVREPPVGAVPVCRLDRLIPERGAAVLVGGHQVALFRVEAEEGTRVHAVSHRDPFSGAHVIGRGIVGSTGKRVTVASPMYKQVFDLATGECLSDPEVRLAVWRAFVEEGVVHLEPQPLDLTGPDATSGAVSRGAAVATG